MAGRSRSDRAGDPKHRTEVVWRVVVVKGGVVTDVRDESYRVDVEE